MHHTPGSLVFAEELRHEHDVLGSDFARALLKKHCRASIAAGESHVVGGSGP
jgi:hypothetical protein